MPKLTDTQLVILSAASQRKDRALLPLPKSLKLNKGALTTVLKSLLKHDLISEQPAGRDQEHWRDDGGQKLAVVITDVGLKAIRAEVDTPHLAETSSAKAATKKISGHASAVKAGSRPRAKVATAAKGTKLAQLIGLLKRKSGANIEEVSKVIGWQAHSVRGAISGTLKKKFGLAVSSEAIDGRGRVYRIVAGR